MGSLLPSTVCPPVWLKGLVFLGCRYRFSMPDCADQQLGRSMRRAYDEDMLKSRLSNLKTCRLSHRKNLTEGVLELKATGPCSDFLKAF